MRIICAGEAMAELRLAATDPGGAPVPAFTLGFAGDTFNTAVYLRRLGIAPVAYHSRIGTDPLSDGFLAMARAEGLDTDTIRRDPDRTLGIYALHTDSTGERSFHYWRSDSAARQMFGQPAEMGLLAGADLVYLSGITLAILAPATRAALLDRIAALRPQGLRFAFDSNHRPRLWGDQESARRTIERAWRLADIALPSVDDEMALFGDADATAVLARLRGWGCREGALKCGAAGPLALCPAADSALRFDPAPAVVDTTAAGDSFNAGWLSAHLAGLSTAQCLARGHALARHVVARPGAIVDLSGLNLP
jgi:2-dehydro-3-deoxygluconokinase